LGPPVPGLSFNPSTNIRDMVILSSYLFGL